jgi:hypothetical protein
MSSQQENLLVDPMELKLAQQYTAEYLHGLEIGTSLFHSDRSLFQQNRVDIHDHAREYGKNLGKLARDACERGVTAAFYEPLSSVYIDLGDSDE